MTDYVFVRRLLAVALLGTCGQAGWAANLSENPEQSAAALKILEPWQKSQTQSTQRVLHIVCWTPTDRGLPAGHRERLTRMLLHIQNFYAGEMERNGFGKRTFNLKLDNEGQVVLHEIRGLHPTSHYNGDSGSEIRKECVPRLKEAGIEADQETLAIFCNLANWDEKALTFSANSPYYAGGSYRSGTAWQLDSPELDTLNLPKSAPLIQNSQYGRISLGKHNSIFIGGIAHELGHAFGLPHNKQRPDESVLGTALMGSGNSTYGDELRGEGKGSFLTFANALRLASHPLFCRLAERQQHKPQSAVTNFRIRTSGKSLAISGTIVGEPPIYGIVAYFDPEGGGDYNATTATAIPDADGNFQLECDALVAGQNGVLRLEPLHVNGALTDGATRDKLKFSYKVAANGTPDAESYEIRKELEPIIQALTKGNSTLARRLAREIEHPRAAAIALALTDLTPPTQTPAEYKARPQQRPLTSFKPNSATVGWNKPTFDRIPEASLLLESAGEFFVTGIYAHAPARHEYSLGGRWDGLTGTVGLASGHGGTVVFEIKGDGRELWKSPTVKSDKLIPFQVSVEGVQKLELIASPTDDGSGSDWGLWLEPQLLRSR